MTSLKFSKFNFTAAVENFYAQFAPVNRGLNSAYIMLQQLFGKYFRYAWMCHWYFQSWISPLLYAIFMRSLRQWVEDFILHISRFNNFSKVLLVCANGVIKNLNINFSAFIGNIYAHVAPVNRWLNWAYFMFKNRFRKYIRHVHMRSFIFEQINSPLLLETFICRWCWWIEDWPLHNYIMLIWMLLWHPLTCLFHEEQEF